MPARRKRILYVQRPNGGGTATGLYDLVRTLDTSLYEPVVLFYRANRFCERFRHLGARVLVLEGPTSARPLPGPIRGVVSGLRTSRRLKQLNRLVRNDWPLARRIARLIRQEAVDLVHHNDNPRADRASIIAARLAGMPQICHVRALGEYFRPIDRRLSSWVSSYIYMSRVIERHWRDAIGIAADRGEVVYDPFDFTALGDGDRASPRLRAEFGLAEDARVISNVGRLVPWKGQDVFLQAMSEVVRAYPNVRVLIVGAPNPQPAGQDYYQRLERLTVRLGLSGHVIFTGHRSDIPEIMAASDIVVHSASEPEPFGRVVVEAMAAARPVVATAAGGVLEIVDDQETGLLVPLEDPAAMAGAIRQLLGDPPKAGAMGRRARQEVRRRFAPTRFVEAMERVYGRVLNGRSLETRHSPHRTN
jgi:glycosyltransferase involved in cell wall biosynthesis